MPVVTLKIETTKASSGLHIYTISDGSTPLVSLADDIIGNLVGIYLQRKVETLRPVLTKEQQNVHPVDFSPESFRDMTENLAPGLFSAVERGCTSYKPPESIRPQRADSKQSLVAVRTVSSLCSMAYTQSQKSNSFQTYLSTLSTPIGTPKAIVGALHKIGMSVSTNHLQRNRKALVADGAFEQRLQSNVDKAVANGSFVVANMDDFHNIHTKRQPDTVNAHDVAHLCNLVVIPSDHKIQPIPSENRNKGVNRGFVDTVYVVQATSNYFASLCRESYGEQNYNMLQRAFSKQPHNQCQFLNNVVGIHTYNPTATKTRSFDDAFLVNSFGHKMKSLSDY